MKAIHLLKILERYPLFTENDVAKIINKSKTYVKTYLYRLHKRNLITRIERGKYTVHEDPLIFASYIITPSYLGLWTALRFHNMTQQQPIDIIVLSPKARKPIKLPHGRIVFRKTGHMFGYKKERYGDIDIFIADKEKTIIDALLFRLPVEDIRDALKDADPEKLVEYARRTKKKVVIRKLGRLLGQIFKNDYDLLSYTINKKCSHRKK